ncbi:hypothetical protein ASJ81_21080 [Methanosarcina spelaei]|jgi:hypothetical protein|uniref:Transposase n=1 Tax=Methanosarcina spelaei TaxID=1036679 RepID=A0A2A2HR97_9EURY|nr:hypothetical protein [Methanosarcina spelaei]PAV12041.1 hypothetical protein ASJ81_21080 [Methanosarcina spelaei]
MEFIGSSITFKQKNLVIKSLNYMERHKKIDQYCKEYCKKNWTDLSFDEANNLIGILDKMAWR